MSRVERKPATPSSTDLFGWLDALYTKAKPDGTPPTYMMHRFMASDRDYAAAARELQQEVREPELIFATWQCALPLDRAAPRFKYVAAKKPPQEEELVARMKQVLAEGRAYCEAAIAVARLAGREAALYREFGVEHGPPPAAPEPTPTPRRGLI